MEGPGSHVKRRRRKRGAGSMTVTRSALKEIRDKNDAGRGISIVEKIRWRQILPYDAVRCE